MTDSNSNSVPIDPHIQLHKVDEEADKDISYRKAIGSLMHLAILSRPDISVFDPVLIFAVSLVSHFLNCYNTTHWNAVQRIFNYLKDTKDYALCHTQTEPPVEVTGYSGSDYANDLDTSRSVTGYILMKLMKS